tara:strand:- start:1012 stop:2697 length:1686 start_codon:yes stop_codon:yes gene_type:complete
MFDIVIFISAYLFLLFSILGYGIFFYRLSFEKLDDLSHENSIYIGFYGLFFVTLISLFTSLFLSHNLLHNSLLHIFGVFYFLTIKIKNKKEFSKIIFFISIIVFSALLISKTHDDFSYYHFPFTKYLTENKIIFGMGNINHGYNLLSSLFFLNSTFYLPLIGYYSFHYSTVFFLIFFNFFIFKEILSSKNEDLIKFLFILALSFFNLSFNRIAEYGTDKPGQLLISILVIKLIQIVLFNKEKEKISKIIFLLPLLAYCISLKTYFLPYIILGLIIFTLKPDVIKSLKSIFNSKSFIFFSLILIIYFFHHFVSTGCIISPLAATCFEDQFSWARKDMIKLSIWVEQWSKAGAGPNFRVENVQDYIKNFNWVSNWAEKYFYIKVLDQLAILFSSIIVLFLIFKDFKFNQKNRIKLDKKLIFFYILILIIFLTWFSKHPTLRYGGYAIVFLIISVPASVLISNFKNRNFFNKRLKFFIIFVIIVFNFKNINRIGKEIERGDHYKFQDFPFFALKEKDYKIYDYEAGLKIYSAHHCWSTPTPCGQVNERVYVKKFKNYYFIHKSE